MAPTDRPNAPAARGERLARVVLAALLLAAPVGLGLRVALGERAPEPTFQRPASNDFVLVTFGAWADPREIPRGPAFDDLVHRGQRVGPIWAGTDHRPGAAATFWTGRSPPSHGVLANGRRLEHGAWSLASAARAGGARTAAFLSEPLVSDSGLDGFEQVVEDAGLGAEQLGRLAQGFLEREPSRRVCLWLHLADPGPEGQAADALLASVDDALVASARDADVVLVVTAFSNRLDLADEARLLVPWISRLPAAIQSGSLSRAALAHVDATHLLRRILRLAPPSALAGQAPLHGDALVFWAALRGTPETSWVWLEGEFGSVLRQPGLRAHRPPGGEVLFQALSDTRHVGAHPPLQGAAVDSARWIWAERRTEAARR